MRTTSIATALALAASAAVATGFGSSAVAGPADQGSTLTPVPTEPAPGPAPSPPTTSPLEEAATLGEPVDPGGHAPMPPPVTTIPVGVDEQRVDATVSRERIQIDPVFAPDPEYLAPCAETPYNLEPVEPIVLADMTGDGTADDRLSIREVDLGDTSEFRLHLETADGLRSETIIPTFVGQTPTVGDLVQLWEFGSTKAADTPDEVLIRLGTSSTAEWWRIAGVDERGCVAVYDQRFGPSLTLGSTDGFRSGWRCHTDGRLDWIGAGRNTSGSWWVDTHRVGRRGPTSYSINLSHGRNGVPASELPAIGDDC